MLWKNRTLFLVYDILTTPGRGRPSCEQYRGVCREVVVVRVSCRMLAGRRMTHMIHVIRVTHVVRVIHVHVHMIRVVVHMAHVVHAAHCRVHLSGMFLSLYLVNITGYK